MVSGWAEYLERIKGADQTDPLARDSVSRGIETERADVGLWKPGPTSGIEGRLRRLERFAESLEIDASEPPASSLLRHVADYERELVGRLGFNNLRRARWTASETTVLTAVALTD